MIKVLKYDNDSDFISLELNGKQMHSILTALTIARKEKESLTELSYEWSALYQFFQHGCLDYYSTERLYDRCRLASGQSTVKELKELADRYNGMTKVTNEE